MHANCSAQCWVRYMHTDCHVPLGAPLLATHTHTQPPPRRRCPLKRCSTSRCSPSSTGAWMWSPASGFEQGTGRRWQQWSLRKLMIITRGPVDSTCLAPPLPPPPHTHTHSHFLHCPAHYTLCHCQFVVLRQMARSCCHMMRHECVTDFDPHPCVRTT
jgi:hypothetical protein